MVRQIRGRKATILSKEKEAAVAKALEAGRLAPCCVTCGLWSSCRTYHMKPDGDKDTAEILFIGEAPGADEDAVGRPFMGKSGTLLRNALAHNSVTNFVMDNAVKCRPVNNTTPTMKHVKSCFPYTQDLIYSMPNLKLIVPVGNIALRALTGELGILGKSGKQFSWQNFKMMPLIHPASVLRQSGSLKDFHDHVARIPNILRGDLVSESDFGNYIMIASLDTWRELVNKIKERKLFVYDVETNGLNQFGADFKLKGISFSVEPREAYWLEWHLPVMSEEDTSRYAGNI